LIDYATDAEEGFRKRGFLINVENCRMYDRDYVKALEQEIELNGGNRFEGWRLSTERGNTAEPKRPEQTTGPAEEPVRK